MAAVTILMFAPSGTRNSTVIGRNSGTSYAVDANGRITVTDSMDIEPLLALGYTTASNAVPQSITAAGATQGAATPITSRFAVITVSTASARGAILPAWAANDEVLLASNCTQGTKIYPPVGARIGAAATNIAVVIAGFKANIYRFLNAKTIVVLKGT